MIDISVDAASNETYKKIRVGGDLDVTRSNILKLLKLREEANSKTKIIVSFVEQKENSHEVEDFKNYWQQRDVDGLIRRLHSNSGSNLVDKLKSSDNQNRRPCLYLERVILTQEANSLFVLRIGMQSLNYVLIMIKQYKKHGRILLQRLRSQHSVNFQNF